MLTLQKVKPISKEMLEEIGLEWHTDSDGSNYISDSIVTISQKRQMHTMRQPMPSMRCM